MVLWAKLWKDNRILKDMTAVSGEDTRTHRIYDALDKICLEFDLGKPIWLESNIREFRRHNKTRFTRDSFIEETDFDCLEIMILEE